MTRGRVPAGYKNLRIEDVTADQDVLDFVLPLRRNFDDPDELGAAVHFLVVRTRSAFSAALGRDGEATDMSGARLGVLKLLYDAEHHRLPMKEISDRLTVTAGNITRLVSGLVSQGYIRRETPDYNRRVTYAELTEAGAEAFEKGIRPFIASRRELLNFLTTDEKADLIRLLSKLRVGILDTQRARQESTQEAK